MTTTLRHQAIAASAGSGKTFQLAHRYIRLLADGVEPERIVALTFSRKAAGEIFDSIIKYLGASAHNRTTARRTAELIDKPGLEPEDFLHLLRRLLFRLNRLAVATLDSFTVSVVNAFPLELGIDSRIRVIDNQGAEAELLRRQALARIFNRRQVDETVRRNFFSAFKQATFGREEKSLVAILDDFISTYHATYLFLPRRECWGEIDSIWPGGCPWLPPPAGITEAAARLLELLDTEFDPRVRERWEDFIKAAVDFDPAAPVANELKYLLEKLVARLSELREGRAEIATDHRRQRLSQEACHLADLLIRHVIGRELEQCRQQTGGIYAIMELFEEAYEQAVRRRGLLTFNEVQMLLGPDNPAGKAIPSRSHGEGRLFIDYRLDARLDHWLLDEFQDTSDLQWQALSNLIDEAIQDDSGRRSFFYVGDVKQAIYGWRAGNAALFDDILDRYGEAIETVPLDTSYRSGPAVIETVNAVFDSLPDELPSAVVERWRRLWRPHHCALEIVPANGHAALLQAEPATGGKASARDRYRLTAAVLNEIDPGRRGLSVGVLVRKNKQGRELVHLLRNHCPDQTIIHEGNAPLRDTPLVALLLSLVRYAVHPGDTMALGHLLMSPLAGHLRSGPAERPARLLAAIHRHGLAGFFRHWGSLLESTAGLDDFGRQRLADLITAAMEFEAGNPADCDDFLRFIDQYQVKDLGDETAIRVMTIHQAKGLGFDVVVLPELQQDGLLKGQNTAFELWAPREPGGQPALLKMPRRLFAEADPVLAERFRQRRETGCFDELCVLYVALTRARQALYLITGYPGKNARAITPAALVKYRLTGEYNPETGNRRTVGSLGCASLYEAGERQWYLSRPEVETVTEEAGISLPVDYDGRFSGRRRLRRITPSGVTNEVVSGAGLFSVAGLSALDFGSAVHHLLERIGWLEETDLEQTFTAWRKSAPYPETMKNEAVAELRRALRHAPVRELLSRPAGQALLWREKPFDVVLDGNWVSGVFDRVMIRLDGNDRPADAVILDYKSNRPPDDDSLRRTAEGYQPQLELYRRALSRILGLAPERISIRLLFTHSGRIWNCNGLAQRHP